MTQPPIDNKNKNLIEFRHQDNSITTGFVFSNDDETIYDILKDKQGFIYIQLLTEEFIYIAMSDIKAFKICNTNTQEEFHIWSFDPYVILGVDTTIDADTLQKKYVALLQKTHPDIIDTHHLHPGFKSLATDMTRRIISAFEFIQSEISMYKDKEK